MVRESSGSNAQSATYLSAFKSKIVFCILIRSDYSGTQLNTIIFLLSTFDMLLSKIISVISGSVRIKKRHSLWNHTGISCLCSEKGQSDRPPTLPSKRCEKRLVLGTTKLRVSICRKYRSPRHILWRMQSRRKYKQTSQVIAKTQRAWAKRRRFTSSEERKKSPGASYFDVAAQR